MIARARCWVRLARVGLHVAFALAVAWLVFPVVPATARLALGQRWSVRLLGILGVRIPDEVGAVRPGSLIVANHVSWLDVIVLLALCPAAFVAKDELRRWLGLGWLFGRGGALYLKRGSARAAWRLNRTIAAGLAADTPVVIFPEGTTSDGARLLRFYPALFQPAVDGRHAVQPIALAYEDAAGAPCDAVVYAGGTPFWDSLLAIASERAIVARVRLAAPVDSARLTRREAARRTHEIIAQALASHFAARRMRPAPAEAQAFSQSTSAPALAARSSSSMSG